MSPLMASHVGPWITAAAAAWRQHTGVPLFDGDADLIQAAEDAPFALLIHNGGPDPIFQYGNVRARTLFGYTLDELRVLPSRLSAEAQHRQARDAMLSRTKETGIFTGYEGIRVHKDGTRFVIVDATIWVLVDDDGHPIGQAAKIPHVRYLPFV